jgi:DNA-binding NarL/FixJ family response regulator
MLHPSDDSAARFPYDVVMDKQIEVLIVDDQPRARRSLKALLATWGKVGNVSEAANGCEALRQAETHPLDLVVMDVLMPEMDGLAAAREIKARWPDVKIVMLSMYPEYADEALSAGADAFVTKGESPRVLLERLAKVTGRM